MLVGIDASRAFLQKRTGIEEYSYQVIKELRENLQATQVWVYVRPGQKIDFSLPKNWKVKTVNFVFGWTQIGLSWEMFFRPVDVLFVPAHTLPFIHPKNSVVTIHGLEYEFCPEAYSYWERLYMRWSIKFSCRWAKKIIAVSKNTQKDLMQLYQVSEEKVRVIYEGVSLCPFAPVLESQKENQKAFKKVQKEKYLLFVGRLEERKNIGGIIEAFERLKERDKIPHKLILVGKPGFGFEKIKKQMAKIKNREEVIFKGYVQEETKRGLFENADLFLFPSFYEGFGLPILEAQAAGVPVVTSDISSLPEVTNGSHLEKGSALLVNPRHFEEIAEAARKILFEENLRKALIEKGLENVKRFSWKKCAKEISEVLLK